MASVHERLPARTTLLKNGLIRYNIRHMHKINTDRQHWRHTVATAL